MKLTRLTILAACALAIANAGAQQANAPRPDPAKGQAASAVCAGCHGADGNALANTFPKLAGQHYDYIVKQLYNFRIKPGATAAERENAIMLGFASTLTDAQIHDLAAYFSAQVQTPAIAAHPETVELGRKIYRAGIAAKNVPACAGCHGPTGAGIPAQYPRIGGQWPEYTESQLTNFRSGARHNNAAMMTIASRLSDAEIKAVADYVAGLR